MLLPRDEIEGLTSCDLRLLKTKLSKFLGPDSANGDALLFCWSLIKSVCLFLPVNGDVLTFGTKERRALTTRISYYPTNQRRASRNTRLPLITKVGMSPI
jgi:hypothetical protein